MQNENDRESIYGRFWSSRLQRRTQTDVCIGRRQAAADARGSVEHGQTALALRSFVGHPKGRKWIPVVSHTERDQSTAEVGKVLAAGFLHVLTFIFSVKQ